MTKETAHKLLNMNGDINTAAVIDYIYDDFESRICSNCKWYKNEVCENYENLHPGYEYNENLIPPDEDFSCNRWESKDAK